MLFRSLAVAVVDEQHRFGVRQRAALDGEGRYRRTAPRAPHVLHMTATPIPRTLALATYGDLDVSILRELPRGRRAIADARRRRARRRAPAPTRRSATSSTSRSAGIRRLPAGESETRCGRRPGGRAACRDEEFERLAVGSSQGFRLVLLHGQMRPAEKQAAMAAFAAGRADVLVATTVIEVGIDVPNATVMLVENAERFGISQLHQLRGRVGRGEHASLCLLWGRTSARLRAVAKYRRLRARRDRPALRKEGELVGMRQSGIGQFRVALLPIDSDLLESARVHAERIVDADSELTQPEHVLLAHALRSAFGDETHAPIHA